MLHYAHTHHLHVYVGTLLLAEAGWWLSGHQEVFNRKPDAVAEVSDDVLRRIRGALKLGLHEGGTQCEKDQAMRLATKLMQSYGLSQAGA